MRGNPDPQLAMLTTLGTEELIPKDHPIRKIHVVVDALLSELDPVLDRMYAVGGRASVPISAPQAQHEDHRSPGGVSTVRSERRRASVSTTPNLRENQNA